MLEAPARRQRKGRKYMSKWFDISSALYLGAQCSSPQIPLIIPSCELQPNLVPFGQETVEA